MHLTALRAAGDRQAAAAVQVAAAERARQVSAHSDEDFSVVIRAMERLSGVEAFGR